jgi:hypothetical protein
MKLLCKTCNKYKHDTNFSIKTFFWVPVWLDTSKCQLCINPNMYDEVKEHFNKLINEKH